MLNEFKRMMEYGVDGLSTAIAKMFKPIDWNNNQPEVSDGSTKI